MPSALIEVHTTVCHLPAGLPLSANDASRCNPIKMFNDCPLMSYTDAKDRHPINSPSSGYVLEHMKDDWKTEHDMWRWSDFQLPPSRHSPDEKPSEDQAAPYWVPLHDDISPTQAGAEMSRGGETLSGVAGGFQYGSWVAHDQYVPPHLYPVGASG